MNRVYKMEWARINIAMQRLICKCGIKILEFKDHYKSAKADIHHENKEFSINQLTEMKLTLQDINKNCGLDTESEIGKIESFIADVQSEKWERIEEKLDELYLGIHHHIVACGYGEE